MGLGKPRANVLNSKDILPRKGVIQNTKLDGWDLFGREMGPNKVVDDPVSIQASL
jgi:hypothetical protein